MVIHFNNPKVQATVQANTFAISGNGETKSVGELLPGQWSYFGIIFSIISILFQFQFQACKIFKIINLINFLGILQHLVGLTSSSPTKAPKSETIAEENEDVPELEEDFDEASRTEGL